MTSARFERACRVEASLALDRAAQWFARNGYEIVARSTADINLFHAAGSSSAARIDQSKHRLNLRSDGSTLTFSFDLGMTSPAAPIEPERTELERRVDAATAAAHGQTTGAAVASPNTQHRCVTCGTMAEAGAQTCEVCGSRL